MAHQLDLILTLTGGLTAALVLGFITERLRFSDGAPVRAASAVVRLGDGRLVVSDDATHAAWFRPGVGPTRVRLLPPVEGHEVFDEQSGTKHLKPDLETACQVEVDGEEAVLVMGSGSSPRRMRWCLVRMRDGVPEVTATDRDELYADVADSLGLDPDDLNLEGACIVGRVLRWFHRACPRPACPAGASTSTSALPCPQPPDAWKGRSG